MTFGAVRRSSVMEKGIASRKAIVKWLLHPGPWIRWQVVRDLTDEPDAAMAVDVVKERQYQNGRWLLNGLRDDHVDGLPFEREAGVVEASRWMTLRALRVPDWYET